MPFADSKGVNIHYEVEGNGPPLVLLHGLGSSMDSWVQARYVEPLAADYTVVLVDARDHGQSDKPHGGGPFSVDPDIMSDDIIAVLDHAGIERAHFWGYSMGGKIGYMVGVKYSHRLVSLIIGGAHPCVPKFDYYRLMFQIGIDSGTLAMVNAMEREGGQPIQGAERQNLLDSNPQDLYASVAQDKPDISTMVGAISVPCLLYVGDNDPNLEQVSECVNLIPQANFEIIEGADHSFGFLRKDLVLPVVAEWLSNVGSRQS